MFRNKSVSVHQFSMIPRADIPRSAFRIQKAYKTTFDAGYLVPVYVDEILPGDSFNVRMTAFARLSTPIVPIMDNLTLSSFFFFVPYRLLWENFERFMGEQDNPTDSVSFVIPKQTSPTGGYALHSVADYFGLPTVGQVTAGATVTVNTLPFRAYNLIYHDWFRDQNLQLAPVLNTGDGPDNPADFILRRRGKRHDYFTACLPWPQKGNTAVSLPLGTSAPIIPSAAGAFPTFKIGAATGRSMIGKMTTNANVVSGGALPADGNMAWDVPNLMADLSQATAATINQLRQAFQIQRFLERQARGGTRYVETIRSQFGVVSPDFRLGRPEYLGGGRSSISINPIAQTSATGITGGSTPTGSLGAVGTALAQHGFSQSFTEHGFIIGMISVQADLTYQQGLRRMWSRSTLFDHYVPAFAMLGEQAVLQKEIYCTGVPANDDLVWGYQERWAEYRYNPSEITGLFRSTAAGTLDPWHLAQKFTSAPQLNGTFMQDSPPLERVLAIGAAAAGKHFLLDCFFDIKAARPMPMYSVPGHIDHL